MLRVAVPETHRKQGRPSNWRRKHRYLPVLSNQVTVGKVKVPVTKGRYFCLEELSSFDNTNIAAIAEFDVLDEKGENLVKTGRLFMPTARKP